MTQCGIKFRGGSRGAQGARAFKAQVFLTNIILHRRVLFYKFKDIAVMFLSTDSLYYARLPLWTISLAMEPADCGIKVRMAYLRVQRAEETAWTRCGDSIHPQYNGADDVAIHSSRRLWSRRLHRPRRRQSADTTWRRGRRWLAETETGNGGRVPLYSRPPKSHEVPGEWRALGRTAWPTCTAFQRQASYNPATISHLAYYW